MQASQCACRFEETTSSGDRNNYNVTSRYSIETVSSLISTSSGDTHNYNDTLPVLYRNCLFNDIFISAHSAENIESGY